MADRSLILMCVAGVFYSMAGAITAVFLPNYYLQIGLSINQIILLTAAMLVTLGLVPVLTLRFIPSYFEKLLVVGILLTPSSSFC